MVGAYTGGAYPLGITGDDVSLDDHFGWAAKDQVADGPILFLSAFTALSPLLPGAYATGPATAPIYSVAQTIVPVATL